MSDQGIATREPWGLWGLPVRLVVVATLAVTAIWLLFTLQSIVLQLLLGIVLSNGFAPLVGRLERFGLPRAVSVLLIYGLFIIVLVVVGFVVVPPLVQEIQQVAQNAPQYAEVVLQRLDQMRSRFPFLPSIDEGLTGQLSGQIGQLAGRTLAIASVLLGALSGLAAVVFVLLITLYLVADGARIREYFLSFLAISQRERVRVVTSHMGQRMGHWFLGQLALSAIVGIITFIGLTILGVPGAVLLAVIAAVGEVVPVIGPLLAALPAVIVAFLQSPFQGIAAAVFYIVLQQVENYALVPNIVGRAVKLPPLAVLFALLIGAALLGLIGALLAVPVAAALAVLLDEFRQQDATVGYGSGQAAQQAVELARREREREAEEH